ncbi:MAG: phage Gp37/Gp68 family protein [bacterium]
MAVKSLIEWTESTWNPITGCTKISLGCKNCYAERLSKRLQAMGQPNYKNGFKITLHPHAIEIPLHWKIPQMVFVNSMSDLFHEDVPSSFIIKIFEVMNKAEWHIFQILTKRSHRLSELAPRLNWTPNIWMGVTIESQDYIYRIDNLRTTSAPIKFLSMEPLLGPICNLNLKGIDWVIVGGESGPGARPIEEYWINDILKKCESNYIPFFFKQWGGFNKKKNGRLLKGKTWDGMPKVAFAYL